MDNSYNLKNNLTKAYQITLEEHLHIFFNTLQSEIFERGEAINEVLNLALEYRDKLGKQLESAGPEKLKRIFWHLDNLIHEASNILNRPTQDLFLYLKAFHSLQGVLRKSVPGLSAKPAPELEFDFMFMPESRPFLTSAI